MFKNLPNPYTREPDELCVGLFDNDNLKEGTAQWMRKVVSDL